jgi:BirA family transcriptional regulator, biotin operon repressor / biotin---[acetyl-CoA-carboxylase] ligase
MKNLIQKIIHFSNIDSTQNYAKKIAKTYPSGTIVVAEQQTKGRGRFERVWNSKKGGLFFSLILKTKIEPQKTSILTYKMALAILDTISSHTKQKVLLKWPNDVMILTENNKYKKIAGILTEISLYKNKVDWIIIGVGINIHNKIPKHLKNKAISLNKITKLKVSTTKILKNVIKNFEKHYFMLSNRKVLDKYENNLAFFRKKTTINSNGTKYHGKILGVTNIGGLEILLLNDTKKIFYSGNIVLA